jgi:orotate phosphoribosyltransferase
MPYCQHYSRAQDPDELLEIARVLAYKLFLFKEQISSSVGGEAEICLVYSGMSGVSIATAVMLELRRTHRYAPHMAYVRKKNEQSHGSPVEFTHMARTADAFIFIDDFISSGATCNYCSCMLERYMRGKKVTHYITNRINTLTQYTGEFE